MARECSVAAALTVVGEQWSLLILREVFLGVRRFDGIMETTGVSRTILTSRLRSLVAAGVLERIDYHEAGSRTRQEYRLTPAGRELQPVLTALMQWGDRYLVSPAGPPLTVFHADCGATVRATLRCEQGHVLPDTGHALNVRHNR
ncbi:helix-turn-helix domain-containing protein [Rhodococcus sp. IEGM 1241]|uniref:winged helix-turn-helix transcriptional regulator n=1 Tax=Rhodococcus sp. IEGM 1241 TaxID=3082228 RepID=UPI002953732B|nr:helix-turn-helix domain-containing protein [Rhodococcus sp. IEGM 1241]MDV8013875.1 helix-turn-helix domain-containing protein [Rhodococcus sp. IEGM 1241]